MFVQPNVVSCFKVQIRGMQQLIFDRRQLADSKDFHDHDNSNNNKGNRQIRDPPLFKVSAFPISHNSSAKKLKREIKQKLL
jgi:hypothetical protein